jgi:hypothetical protein
MKFQELAIEVKTLNILDMALSFSAMARVFSTGSKPRILIQLNKLFAEFPTIRDERDYDRVHSEFLTAGEYCREPGRAG